MPYPFVSIHGALQRGIARGGRVVNRSECLGVAARYINRELMAVFLLTVVVLLLVGIGGRFIGYLQDAVAGKYAADALFTILRLRLPEFLQLILPFALYLSLLLTLSRLYADSEMVVLQTGGLSTFRLLAWIAPLSLVVCTVVAWLAIELTPVSNQRLGEFFLEQRARQDFQNVSPGVFNANSRETRVVYAETVSADREQLGTVFIWERLPDGREATTWANTGRQSLDRTTGSVFLLLDEGRRYEGVPGQADYRVAVYASLGQRLLNQSAGSNRVGITGVLTDELPVDGDGMAEFHWRLAMPIFTLAAVMIAVALARVRPRASRFSRILPGLLVLLCYYLAMMGNRYALEEDILPPMFGLWTVHIVMLGFLAWLLHRSSRPLA